MLSALIDKLPMPDGVEESLETVSLVDSDTVIAFLRLVIKRLSLNIRVLPTFREVALLIVVDVEPALIEVLIAVGTDFPSIVRPASE